jgi:hypothetical protein
MKPSSFDILKQMSLRNMDIRMSRLADNLINVRRTKRGGEVTIGVDEATCQDIMNFALNIMKHNAVLMVWDMDQYLQIKKELLEETK